MNCTISILNEGDITEALQDFNTRHYGQVKSTVFGGGDIYSTKKLTDDPMNNLVYEEILNGTFAF